MLRSLQTLIFLLGVFMAIGLRNISIGQAFSGAFTGFITGADTTYTQWTDYQKENTKRGIGKIQPYNGKPYNNNDF